MITPQSNAVEAFKGVVPSEPSLELLWQPFLSSNHAGTSEMHLLPVRQDCATACLCLNSLRMRVECPKTNTTERASYRPAATVVLQTRVQNHTY